MVRDPGRCLTRHPGSRVGLSVSDVVRILGGDFLLIHHLAGHTTLFVRAGTHAEPFRNEAPCLYAVGTTFAPPAAARGFVTVLIGDRKAMPISLKKLA